MKQPRKYLSHLELKRKIFGNEERYKLLKDVMKNGTLLPKTVNYKDIDSAFKNWVEEKLKISFNNKILPTMVLYSNQRFTEYSQTWKYTDENKNLILNFKTVTRENDPQYGQIQGGLWNIPGNRFYLMKKQIVLDDSGSESIQALKMRQPMAVDFNYTVSIYATHIDTINEFNRIVNDRFKARQDYVSPNGYYMPMTLENISDKSSYQIDDRQFYSQSFDIKLMGYVLTEEDFRVEEQPLKINAGFGFERVRNKASIEVEEYENPCNQEPEKEKYYPKKIKISIDFGKCANKVEFDFDENIVIDDVKLHNLRENFVFTINDEHVENVIGSKIFDGDSIAISVTKKRANMDSFMELNCHSIEDVYSHENDEPEIDADFSNVDETIELDM